MGNKELLAVIYLLTDAVTDGISAAEDGFKVTDIAKFANLLPELIPAVQGLSMVPAELKALTFKDDSEIVLAVVARAGISNVKALAIINASIALAADLIELLKAIKG